MVKDTETTTTTEGQAAVILPVQIEPSDDHQTTDTEGTAVESELEIGQFSLFLVIFHQNSHYFHAKKGLWYCVIKCTVQSSKPF